MQETFVITNAQEDKFPLTFDYTELDGEGKVIVSLCGEEIGTFEGTMIDF